jgi:TPR repeat protein
MKCASKIRVAFALALAVASGAAASAAEPAPPPAQSTAPASIAAPASQPETPFDTASRLYQAGKEAEALVTLRQLAEAGDARAQYLVGLDLIEGKHIKVDYAQGFAYLVLATEDTLWGDLVAPRAKEARAIVEPQLSGVDLIHADALIAAYRQRKK